MIKLENKSKDNRYTWVLRTNGINVSRYGDSNLEITDGQHTYYYQFGNIDRAIKDFYYRTNRK